MEIKKIPYVLGVISVYGNVVKRIWSVCFILLHQSLEKLQGTMAIHEAKGSIEIFLYRYFGKFMELCNCLIYDIRGGVMGMNTDRRIKSIMQKISTKHPKIMCGEFLHKWGESLTELFETRDDN